MQTVNGGTGLLVHSAGMNAQAPGTSGETRLEFRLPGRHESIPLLLDLKDRSGVNWGLRVGDNEPTTYLG
jgi:hypothetical protein